jgi:hypothetical protein
MSGILLLDFMTPEVYGGGLFVRTHFMKTIWHIAFDFTYSFHRYYLYYNLYKMWDACIS